MGKSEAEEELSVLRSIYREKFGKNYPMVITDDRSLLLHRFNMDCDPDEAEWIRCYCRSHRIDCENYAFDWDKDMQCYYE